MEAPDFEVLLIAWSVDGKYVDLIDLSENNATLIKVFGDWLTNPDVLKTAHNANFERTCLSKYFGIELPAEQWQCTMVKAAMLGLPHSLDQVAKVLKLQHQKDAAGKALIKYFSMPCKPTKANGMCTRNLPNPDKNEFYKAHGYLDILDDLELGLISEKEVLKIDSLFQDYCVTVNEKWQKFKDYCVQDVVVEQAIQNKIAFFQIPAFEKQLWNLDQKINDTGVLLDPVFINNAIAIDNSNKERLTTRAENLTGLDNPNSAAQLKEWLSAETGSEVTSLTKDAIPELLQNVNCEVVTEVLKLRQEMAKTSVKKYAAMLNGICADNRLRGLLQFYGANRTGRWAGRLVQVQNLPKNELKDLDLARQLVYSGDSDMVELMFDNVPDTLSQLIRTAFVAPMGSRFIVADFSAIEARVIAWLANEKWRLDVFNSHGKIYEASAAQMFKIPIEKVTKGSTLRQQGKVAELALGYQGGPNALIKMGALKMGIPEKELPKLVAMWRNANKKIENFWYTVQEAAQSAVLGEPVTIKPGIKFYCKNNLLYIELPSGRTLCYLRPAIRKGKYGNDVICYEGMDQTTKKWCVQETYGGKLVENIVQAVARDCLAVALLRLDTAGYKIVMHVHDEVVLEVPEQFGSVDQVNKIMSEPIPWAAGLPLTADSYETFYYRKD
ncbi:DNA polymerase [Acinetobacter sp.]|uniref:DNA polymerase n=1 Tax=Acinetobacter sp. TaxID=472 RepID=UPI0025C1B912|nr:DNA polymerase [Acinetobacter sp.]